MGLYVVHYAEIALKGKKRSWYARKLMGNIREKLPDASIEQDEARLVVQAERAEPVLERTSGVKNFSPAVRTESTMDSIGQAARQALAGLEGSFAVKAKRSWKQFLLTSQEINEQLGDIAVQQGLEIDLDNPDTVLHVEVTKKHAYLYTKKIQGPGGLPVSSTGKVLCLLSGGIDSPVAAWMMMKRGCAVDFIHFHPMQSNEQVLESKIADLREKLDGWQLKSRLYIVPYVHYQLDVPANDDLVLFRHFMLRLAEQVAVRDGHAALVTGDNLAQVASQTLENLQTASHRLDIQVLRPLIGMDKDDIITLARRIGTYESSCKEYKDCCSILARNPDTAVSREKLQRMLSGTDMDGIIRKTMDDMLVLE